MVEIREYRESDWPEIWRILQETVRAGDTVTVREGIGTGFGRASQPELAHDMALKAAETDATKRALATFGNPFGLALYDRDQAQVTKGRRKSQTAPGLANLVLTNLEGQEVRFASRADFLREALHQIDRLDTAETAYAFWSRNPAVFGKLTMGSEEGQPSARQLADALKERAREIGEPLASTSISATEANAAAGPTKGSLLTVAVSSPIRTSMPSRYEGRR